MIRPSPNKLRLEELRKRQQSSVTGLGHLRSHGLLPTQSTSVARVCRLALATHIIDYPHSGMLEEREV